MIRAAAALAVAMTFVAGCGAAQTTQSQPGTTTPAPQTSVAWMTTFCTAIGELRTSLWASPNSSTGTLRTRLESQLNAASSALTTAVSELEALPDTPPSGGPAAVSTLIGRLGELHERTADGKKALTALPPGATEADVGRVMGTIWPKIASMAGDPLAEVDVTDAMKAAASDLSCRSLSGLR